MFWFLNFFRPIILKMMDMEEDQMNIKNTVLELLEEICQTDVVKENLDVELFEEGLLDSFGKIGRAHV